MEQERGTQVRVGFFLLLGLTIVAVMVIYFGRLGEGIKQYYDLRVDFPNASGLIKGANVLMAGAKIGRVADGPHMVASMDGVYVTLKIYDEVRVPKESTFSIGSSGLLGDRFIQVVVDKQAIEAGDLVFLEPGDQVQGVTEAGMDALMAEGAALMTELRETVDSYKQVAIRVNTEVLSDATLKDLQAAIGNVKTTSESFAGASQRLDEIMAEAQKTVSAGTETMEAAKKAADEVTKAVGQVGSLVSDARALVTDARKGRGPVGMLLNDQQTAENLRALVTNMRRHGILFYRDSAERQERQGR